ncbi:MAG: hypothetical protein K1X78_19490 [Verrucomicrobiaceae bacterium]|nr:hypothetical protein [Verrucomicrobiaceae bacterium]
MTKKIHIAIIALAVSLIIVCIAFAIMFSMEPKKIPAQIVDKFFANNANHRAPNSEKQKYDPIPTFGPGDAFEIEKINGVELKVYKGADGKKHYVGPPGLRLLLDMDGNPLHASIDEAAANQAELMMKSHINQMHKLMEEEKKHERDTGR